MAKRVLVVDDSVTIQKAFAMTFAAEDVTIVAARSAEEGLALAQRSRPDLIIADGVMSGRSGYDLCALTKSDPALRGVPVYILTSSHNPYDELQGRHVAADGHLVKPFDSGAMIASVGEALARGAAAAALPASPPSPPARTSGVYSTLGDDYGEISVGAGSGVRAGAAVPARPSEIDVATPPPAAPLPPAPARPSLAPATAAPSPAGGMRPSLIPGLRPGIPTARPGTLPTRGPGVPGGAPASFAASAAPAPAAVPGLAPAPAPSAFPRSPSPQAPAVGMRTMVGIPAAHLQVPPRAPGSMAPTTPSPLRPVAAPAAPPATPSPSMSPGVAAHLADAAAARVAEKMSQIAARGPEYEAIARLSREIIERIAREIIPGLAEAIIREELQKRGR